MDELTFNKKIEKAKEGFWISVSNIFLGVFISMVGVLVADNMQLGYAFIAYAIFMALFAFYFLLRINWLEKKMVKELLEL